MMLSVADARARIVAAMQLLPTVEVGVSEALGRVLAEDLTARRTQPPSAVSAMDGYAVRAEDVREVPARLKLVGYAPAGDAYEAIIGAGEAVRIFTGAPVPEGADTVVIQEDTDLEDDEVVIKEIE
ncbi:MAG TPA: molybdopterin molybdenumtransferase MoeA, partial [Rhodospirillaceae bacterium]|nr:molybdopterin molybdenumtransferase MoeA [Rhodospirillaceae bacterium]